MQIRSTVRPGMRTQRRVAAPLASPPEAASQSVAAGESGRSAKEWADVMKARGTLVGLVEPLGVTVGYLQTPGESFTMVKDTLSSLWSGDYQGVSDGIDKLAYKGYHPEGVGGAIYRSAQGLKAVTEGAVGALEVYAGITSNDKFLTAMGAADLVEACSKATRAFQFDGVSLGLSVAANFGRTALVAANLNKFSRTQKMKTFLDAGSSVASSMVKSGILVTPALAVMSVCGLGQLAYMNVPPVRTRVDGVLDRALGAKREPVVHEQSDSVHSPLVRFDGSVSPGISISETN